MTRLESLPGVTNGHALLMAILMQQRPRIQVQRVTFFERRQTAQRPAMQAVQSITGLLPKHVEEPAQGGLAGDSFDAQHLTQRRITLQPSHAGELVRAAENTPDISQCHIGRIISVGAGRTVGQDFPQLPAKSLLMQKVRPYDHAAMGGQTLIGE